VLLPTTKDELLALGIEAPDIILVTGDTYIDSPYIGVAVIGNLLHSQGYKVAIIAQPDINSPNDITRLGEPKLFWGISGGSVDSMVANYTPLRKKRRKDDYTPGGENNKRPDRALIAYSNLIKRYFKNTSPIVLGGIEASLRRVAHYDFWSDKPRRSVLFDTKADILVYGMGERAITEVAKALKEKEDYKNIRGICYIDNIKKEGFLELPSFEEIVKSKEAFAKSFEIFYKNNDPLSAKGLLQQTEGRYLIQNPPALHLKESELDSIYDLHYTREVHPYYAKMGKVSANETIKFSITTHRGCYGECNFCAIALHQGRTIISRSEESILREARYITTLSDFKGNIDDVGGPTANMYGYECEKKFSSGVCHTKRCTAFSVCSKLPVSHKRAVELLKKIRLVKGVKRVFVRSGIRYDLILADKLYGMEYLEEIVKHHISGQLKIAPEHSEDSVLKLMGKPSSKKLLEFKEEFEKINKRLNKKQFLTYYFIAAHPGCSESDMKKASSFATSKLHAKPEQVQIFTPTPSTVSTLMYYTQKDEKGGSIFVEKKESLKERQKSLLSGESHPKQIKPAKNYYRGKHSDK